MKLGAKVLGLASVAVLALAPAAAQAGDVLDRVMSTKVLKLSSDPAYPPQSFLDDKNEMDGFDVDVAREIAKRMSLIGAETEARDVVITNGTVEAITLALRSLCRAGDTVLVETPTNPLL